MSKINKSQEEPTVGPEFWHTYAKDDAECPNTWNRELEEWQFDGVNSNGDIAPDAKSTENAAAPAINTSASESKNSQKVAEAKHRRCGTAGLSPMQVELAKWLPAT